MITLKQKNLLSKIPISRWDCTAARAANSSLPRSLENACNALDLEIKKDVQGGRLMKKYMKPRKPSKNNPKLWWDDKNELRKIYRYCLTDLNAEYELDQSIPNLSPSEKEIWELDQLVNERGVLIDIPLVKLIIGMIKEEQKNIVRKFQELTGIEKPTQTARVLEWVNDRLYSKIPNLRANTMRDLLENDLPDEVREVLEYRQSASKTSTAKYTKMLQVVGADNRARELLLYAGATPTLRWAGMRLQPQNFPRPNAALIKLKFSSNEAIEIMKRNGLPGIRKKYGAHLVMDVFAACVRGMLIASPGKEFFVGDWSAIEARLAFWFAEHDEGLKAYRDGRKLYEEMASIAFNMPLKWLLTEEGKNSLERFVGKESILGCQYGMGWAKFLAQCHQKGMKMVTPAIAKKAVSAYRDVHWPVPQAWKNLEKAIVKAIKDPGSVHETNKVSIYVKNDVLLIKLPSGRKLKYPNPRVSYKRLGDDRMVPQIHYWAHDWVTTDEINPVTGKPKRKKTWCEIVSWGGIFFNHIVQGCARDFMAHGMKTIEASKKYAFVLSVHDEAISECDIGKGNTVEFIKLMVNNKPQWGKDAPLIAEGWSGTRYRK